MSLNSSSSNPFDNMARKSIIAIVGPTGVGKTKLGIALAKTLEGEVISVDSLQLYQHGSIITAKPTAQEMDGIKHHLIDYLQPDQEPTTFIDLAISRIQQIHSDNKIPLLVGGSISLTQPLLAHPFIQQCNLSVIFLDSQLSHLTPRLDKRVDEMMGEGLMDEVRQLYDLEQRMLGSNPDFSKGIWKAIGYPELRPAVASGNRDKTQVYMDEGLAEMKKNTTTYAKDQLDRIWQNLIPAVHQWDTNFIVLTVKDVVTFEDRVVRPAISACRGWLSEGYDEPAGRASTKGIASWRSGALLWPVIYSTVSMLCTLVVAERFLRVLPY
jgi:adenylate isopentenyltransferase (cytokinin synthase)